MTLHLGPMHFHHVTDVQVFHGLSGGGSILHVTHGTPSRTDRIDFYNVELPNPTDEDRPLVLSPFPAFHGPTLVHMTRDEIRFEEFTIHFFWKEDTQHAA